MMVGWSEGRGGSTAELAWTGDWGELGRVWDQGGQGVPPPAPQTHLGRYSTHRSRPAPHLCVSGDKPSSPTGPPPSAKGVLIGWA